MKKMKIISSYLTMALFLFFISGIFVNAAETYGRSTVTEQEYNIILLIDKSGSMNRTDKEGLALSAAKQFVDQLCTTYNDLASTANIGVLAFSRKTELVVPLQSLKSKNNVDSIKADIDSKVAYDKPNTGGTDLGTALYDAIVKLQRQTAGNSRNIIVMFTDGYSENVVDEQQAKSNLDDAFELISQLECEVFIVGLNHENSIKAEGKEEIYQIADRTQQGEGIQDKAEDDPYTTSEQVNYLITDNMNSVREFYGKIYAYMIGGSLEPLETQFSITTGGIMEADVTVYSNSKITGLTIWDPYGTVMEEDGRSFFMDGDDYYRIAKIMEPGMGIWTVRAESEDENRSYVIRFYSIEVAVSATWGEVGEFENAGIEAGHIGQVMVTPMYRSEQYQDDSLADSFTQAEYTVSKGDLSETYLLNYDRESGKFVGYFPVTAGQYHISAVLANDTMSRRAECDLTVNTEENDGGKADGDIEPEEGSYVDVMKEYPAEEKNDLEFEIHWYHLAIAASALLLGIAIFMIVAYKTAYIIGDFEIYITEIRSQYTIENTVRHPRGKKFSLWKLVEQVIDDNRDDDKDSEKVPQEKRELLKMLRDEKRRISSIKLVICVNSSEKETRKRKVYKLDKGRGTIRELSQRQSCYTSPRLQVALIFKPLPNGEGEEEEGWGKPTEEIPRRRKGHRG